MKPQKPLCHFIFFVNLVLTLYPATPDHVGPTSRSSIMFTTLGRSRYGHSLFHVDHAAETASTVVDAQSVDDPPSQFTWQIEKFSKLNTRKLYTESFYAGGYKWRVLVFPKGNNVNDLSIYLDAAESATLPFGWSRYIKFSLSVINHIDKKFTVKKDFQHWFTAQESDWGWTSFVPLSELYDPGRGYLLNDTCVVEVNFPGLLSVELKVETVKTASREGETPKSSSEAVKFASGTETILAQTDTSGPPPACKSATKVIKTSVPPTTPIVETESTINSPRAQDPEVELPRSSPMGSPLESSSFDDMDAYIYKLVSVVETDAPFDSTTEGLVAAFIPQSTIDEAKKFFIKMLSRDLLEIPDFFGHLTESISVLSECCDLTPAPLAEVNTLKAEFLTLLKTYQASNHFLKEVDEKMAEKQGRKKSLVEQVKINAFAFQMQRAIQKDFFTKEAKLQQEFELLQAGLGKISEKKSAEKEIKQLHENMVNLEQSRSSVLDKISTLETEKKTAESSLSSVQQKWTELRHTFMEPNN